MFLEIGYTCCVHCNHFDMAIYETKNKEKEKNDISYLEKAFDKALIDK